MSAPKRVGLAAVQVVETRGAAPEGTAGVTDTRCDVRAEVQDGLLQLASGKQVPAMVDCGACGGKKSLEDLNLPVVKDLVGDKTVVVILVLNHITAVAFRRTHAGRTTTST